MPGFFSSIPVPTGVGAAAARAMKRHSAQSLKASRRMVLMLMLVWVVEVACGQVACVCRSKIFAQHGGASEQCRPGKEKTDRWFALLYSTIVVLSGWMLTIAWQVLLKMGADQSFPVR